jgi:biofilm PGA synthesis lipoprotein PgaB
MVHLTVLAYHDVVDQNPDQRFGAITTAHLAEQFDWLKTHGYQPVSLDDVLAAASGRLLPPKPVLLTFDDGFESFSTRAFPLLQAYRYPAILGVADSWVSPPPGGTVRYRDLDVPRSQFMDWNQVRAVARSGLVEIAAETHALQGDIEANPQGDREPAITSRLYDRTRGRYEDDAAYTQRLGRDFASITDAIRRETGRAPHVMVWPRGERNQESVSMAASAGMPITLTLDEEAVSIAKLDEVPRFSIANDPSIGDFVGQATLTKPAQPLRAVRVALDNLYDADVARTERNLNALIDRINRLHISAVFLEAFVEPRGGNPVHEVYFPNRLLPMRADLFNHAAWQLRTRAQVIVYATMPVLNVDVMRDTAASAQSVAGLYEDLAKSASFGGLLLDDDSTQLEARSAIDAAMAQIAERVRRFRGPIKTARSIDIRPTVSGVASEELSQILAASIRNYDYVVITLAAGGQDAPAADATWLTAVVAAARTSDPNLKRTVFSLEASGGRLSERQTRRDTTLAKRMERLRELGVSNFGYFPDNFVGNQAEIQTIDTGISLRTVPAK